MTLGELRQLGYSGTLDEWYSVRCGSEAAYRKWGKENGLGFDVLCYFFVAFICLRRFGGSPNGAWIAANERFRMEVRDFLKFDEKSSKAIALFSLAEIEKAASDWHQTMFKV